MRNEILKILAVGAVLCTGGSVTDAREVRSLNDGWSLKMPGDTAAVAVAVPHSWNGDAYSTRDYYRGTGTYSRTLAIPESMAGKRIWLKLDGAATKSEVRLDGREIGRHIGAYSPHLIDITPYVKPGGSYRLDVIVDNNDRDIPPYSADFTFMGGLYRDVWLMDMPTLHFDVKEGPVEGFKVTTSENRNGTWSLKVRGAVVNDSKKAQKGTLKLTVYSPSGKAVAEKKIALSLKAGADKPFAADFSDMRDINLWSPESPALYRVEAVLNGENEQEVTTAYTAFRTFGFNDKGEFLLNGSPYKLRGMCRHQDQAPMGIGLTDEQHRRDMQLMKDMGANFIRISHYPQDDAILDMCDRLGMIAWEEIPVIDFVPENDRFADNAENMLREMVRSHYNHPSIAMWGYMNEILLRPQGDRPETYKRTLALANRLDKALKEEDPLRPSTMAFHWDDIYHETGIAEVTDVKGWNMYPGWYGGELDWLEQFMARQHKEHPSHKMIVSEYGAGSDRRVHSLNPVPFDFSTEYQQKFLEHYLPVIEDSVFISGGAHWNFIDFSSANRDEAMPHINNKGLVTNARVPKDVYHYYRAMWHDADKDPVAYIATRDWLDRTEIVDRGNGEVTRPVKVYANLPKVALKVNGKDLGSRDVRNRHAVFEVPLRAGANVLQLMDAENGTGVLDAVTVNMTGIERTDRGIDPGVRDLAFNVGSNCYFRSDDSGLTWLPDMEYSVESGYGHIGGENAVSQDHINLTNDDPLYQHCRSGIQEYRVDLVPGEYEVELSFADLSKPSEHSAYMLGAQAGDGTKEGAVMDIYINGKKVESAFAPSELSGFRTMVKRTYRTEVPEGALKVEFRPVSGGETLLSGLKVRKL